MRRDELERMAEGIVRLRSEILRRRIEEGGLPADELTTPQAIALRTVVVDGPFRVGGLAAALGVSDATASRTVDTLEALGLVQRERDPSDARAVHVVATAKGRREHAGRRERFVRALDRFMDELSEHERRQLADALGTVNRLLVPRDPAISARRRAG
jgi:DNA-binding MarR family transcriptional regulator